jgi:hypothetical protein
MNLGYSPRKSGPGFGAAGLVLAGALSTVLWFGGREGVGSRRACDGAGGMTVERDAAAKINDGEAEIDGMVGESGTGVIVGDGGAGVIVGDGGADATVCDSAGVTAREVIGVTVCEAIGVTVCEAIGVTVCEVIGVIIGNGTGATIGATGVSVTV